MEILSHTRTLSHEQREDANSRLAYLLCLLPIITTRYNLMASKLSSEQYAYIVSEYYSEVVNAKV